MQRGVIGRVTVMVMMAAVTCLLQGTQCQAGDSEAEKYQEEAGQIYTTVFHKYKKNVRPPDYYPEPVPVGVHVTLFHIRDLDVLKQELESIIDLDIRWQDKRLAWYANKVEMITEDLSAVWHPSIVYRNGAMPPSPLFSSKVSISMDGIISWKRREIVTTVCPTNTSTPVQLCTISMGFTSPEQVEVFSNRTAFTLHDGQFWNHRWSLKSTNFELGKDSKQLDFLLELQQNYADGSGPYNCSRDGNEMGSSGAAATGGARLGLLTGRRRGGGGGLVAIVAVVLLWSVVEY